MRYLGGKSKLGKQIAYVINKIRQPGQAYWEPFCGSCWVTIHVWPTTGPRYCSDGCYELIEMWKALQRGWKPPRGVTEEMYATAKAGEYNAATTAFIGFGCSFGGKWFAGYARGNTSPAMVRNVLFEKIGKLQDVEFSFEHYAFINPQPQTLIYCDPPYADTEQYDGVKFDFDTECFFIMADHWCRLGHTVIISEYAAPDDFVCVLEMPTTTEIRTTENGREQRTERLFMHKSQVYLYYENVPEQLALI